MPRSIARLALALVCAAATACSLTTAPAERVFTLEVAEQTVPCVGVAPQQCLQVREQPDAEWQLFYDGIDGFVYEPGYRYLLRVAQRAVPDPPADGSSLAFRLLFVISKTATP